MFTTSLFEASARWVYAVYKFTISHGLGDGPIVPLGEDLVEDDLHGRLESRGTLAACLIHLVEDAHADRQARRGFGLGDVVSNRLQRLEDHPATRPCHMREKAV